MKRESVIIRAERRKTVGGHFGILVHGGHVAKPKNPREVAFYQRMDNELKPFTPAFCNEILVHAATDSETERVLVFTSSVPKCHGDKVAENPESIVRFRTYMPGFAAVETNDSWNSQADECQSKVVENLLQYGPKDFMLLEKCGRTFCATIRPGSEKLGPVLRQHGDNSSKEKREQAILKCKLSTSGKLGARLVGMQMYDATNKEYVYIEKQEGRTMSAEQFFVYCGGFAKACGPLRSLKIRDKLQALKNVLMNLEGYRFFSASILVAFDAEAVDSADEDAVCVKLIDFANSTLPGFFSDIVHGGVDDGGIWGVENIIKAMEIEPDSAPTESSSFQRGGFSAVDGVLQN
ncbi:unnamed protein product [Caenorhabditis auriculariae]|uniref:Kinase n=1 Tax=Caenorhabditis auriculariae TaxID=2777116 RepID=A0A8S1HDU5_9PELO|nr:unnamed protein product [Caenorhabditis auriculariae]